MRSSSLRWLRESETPVPIGPPPLLLPIDYASHCYCVIELGSEWSEGGVILEWDIDAIPLVSHSLADRIDMLAELLAGGHFERDDGQVSVDHRVEQEMRSARAGRVRASPRLRGSACDSRPTSARGRRTGSLRAGSTSATASRSARRHSIAELVAAAADGRSRAEFTER